MALNYYRLVRKPHIFLRMTGVTLNQFWQLIEKVSPLWEEQVEKLKKCEGRRSSLPTLPDKVMTLLIYYRTYITHEFLGYLVGLHNSNISRLFKVLEPLMAQKIKIEKDKRLTEDEVIKILADVMEQPTQRPKKRQKRLYSGKKKRHTLKAEIVMNESGKVLSLSRTFGGRRHDFRIRKESKPFPPNTEKFVDSGYQGLQKITSGVHLPFKGSKKRPLQLEQKQHNTKLASFRVRVEHKIRQFKVFRILSSVYRNFQKKHNLRMNIIGGIVNLKYAT